MENERTQIASSGKQLVALISTEGKTAEEIKAAALLAVQNFSEITQTAKG